MSKQNVTKANKSISEVFKFTELELKQKQEDLKRERELACLKDINAVLLKHDCGIVTDVDILVNGKKLNIVIKSN